MGTVYGSLISPAIGSITDQVGDIASPLADLTTPSDRRGSGRGILHAGGTRVAASLPAVGDLSATGGVAGVVSATLSGEIPAGVAVRAARQLGAAFPLLEGGLSATGDAAGVNLSGEVPANFAAVCVGALSVSLPLAGDLIAAGGVAGVVSATVTGEVAAGFGVVRQVRGLAVSLPFAGGITAQGQTVTPDVITVAGVLPVQIGMGVVHRVAVLLPLRGDLSPSGHGIVVGSAALGGDVPVSFAVAQVTPPLISAARTVRVGMDGRWRSNLWPYN